MQQQSKNANSIYNIPDANILNDLKQLEMEEKRDAASILAITATIASLGFLIITISSRYPAAVINTDILKLYVFDASLYKPESNEHVTYFVSALILPFFCGIYYFVSTRLLSLIEERLFIFYQIVSFFLVGSLLALFLRGLTHYNYIPPSSMYNAPVLNLLVNVIMFGWIIVSSRLSKQIIKRMNIALNYVYMFVSVFIIVVVSVGRVFNETEPYVYGFHFTAYFDSVVQVYLGKTLLVNNSAQYGLYALFLKPLFVLFGLSVFKFTLVMCIIEAMWLLCLLFLMRSTIRVMFTKFSS